MLKQSLSSLTVGERLLWAGSSLGIIVAFFLFDSDGLLTLIASLVGAASLIFSAKGNPLGQALMLLFSLLYGVISYSFSYYGEMITYLGMTAPMALFALISWLRNPYNGNRTQVAVNRLRPAEIIFMLLWGTVVTGVFYFILLSFQTANLIPSTISVLTSFFAVYLTFRRSAFFALAYAANDVVLIVLWTMAACADRSYASVVVCFVMFLINDLYGFFSWIKMHRRQQSGC